MKASEGSDPHHLMRWLAEQTVLKPLQAPLEKPLSEQVAALEGNRDAYKALAGEMWATIRLNMDRSILAVCSDSAGEMLEKTVRRWKEILDALAR